MAREAAHQLGTPISSLMGWSELLKLKAHSNDELNKIIEEIDNDIKRLSKITERFSKIGSKPHITNGNIVATIRNVTNYISKRLKSKNNINISIECKREIIVPLNVELFEWVIENLLKNAIDAIGEKKGEIKITITQKNDKVIIDVHDNGKGLNMKLRKDILGLAIVQKEEDGV